jgi:ADP-heptose:LPS heptosyltransferase/glycosyltransferase involved in cell wall biosynthesis
MNSTGEPFGSRPPTLSALILTRNRLALLQQVVAALEVQLSPEDEICVLDTGSQDGTRDWLTSKAQAAGTGSPAWLVELAEPAHLDFAGARNALVRLARGTVVAFLDDDCIPEPGWAAALRCAFDQDGDLVAAGGLALPGPQLRFPPWWQQELNWTVGLSGPDLIAGKPGIAPSTSNLAIRRSFALVSRFGETDQRFDSTAAGGAYRGMREDAQWWLSARWQGARLLVLPECTVRHHIPQERLAYNYIMHRAELDGRADWRRRGSLPLWNRAVSDVSAIFLRQLTLRARPSDHVWGRRQRGLLDEAQQAPSAADPVRSWKKAVAWAMAHRIRQRAVAALGMLAALGRKPWESLPHEGDVAVLAPGFVGDTILLQPALRALAEALHSHSRKVWVWVKWPELLGAMPDNVRVLGPAVPSGEEFRSLLACCRVAVPYYPGGDRALWKQVAGRAVTFDWDVGFGRQSDAYRAGHRIAKDPKLHEVENLSRLLRMLLPPGTPWPELKTWKLVPQPQTAKVDSSEAPPSILLFPHTGHRFKDWPESNWMELADRLARERGGNVLMVPGPGRRFPEASELPEARCWSVARTPDSMQALVNLIARCALVVSGCTGPKHIAHALGRPTVTIYGRTEPCRWGGYFSSDQHTTVLSPGHDLTDDELLGLPEDHVISLVSVEDVWNALPMKFSPS